MGIAILDGVKLIWPFAVNALIRPVQHATNIKGKYIELQKKSSELFDRRDKVLAEIGKDKLMKEVSSECQNWLDEVKKIEALVTNFDERNVGADGKCGCHMDYKQGKFMVKTTEDIVSLLESGRLMVITTDKMRVKRIPSESIKEESSTTYQTLRSALKLIRDSSVSRIGIWGMPGIGKSSLMMNINNSLQLERQFDIVFFVTMPREQEVEKVQAQIAKRLDLIVENLSEESIRRKLCSYMANKKYLLLLDDAWESIDVRRIGLVEPDESNGCKLVLATRDLGVCRRMKTGEEIEMKPLDKEEAWNLFVKAVGTIPPGDDFKNLADAVFEECGNLPATILAVGQSLRNEEHLHVWKHIHREMVSPTKTGIGPHDDLIKLLRVSYDHLDDNVQSCFLFSALFCDSQDIHVDYLIQCWKAEGLLDDNLSFAQAHARGRQILETLMEKCFLTKGSNATYIRMHETYRDLALHIINQPPEGGHRFLVRAGIRLRQTPDAGEWEGVKRISLMHNNLCDLPERPNCSGLSMLFLQHNVEIDRIPDDFFMAMGTLRVLDLSRTGINSLPESLSALSNLRNLYLKHCARLKSLPDGVGANLYRLELLDIRGTGLRGLPEDIGLLPRLQCLHASTNNFRDVTNQSPSMFPSGIISRQQLEEVIIDVSGGDDENWDKKAPVVVDELVRLTNLNALHFAFPDINCFEKFITRSASWKRGEWRSFQYTIGHHDGEAPSIGRREGYMRFAGGDTIPAVVEDALKHTDAFELVGHSSISSLSDFDMTKMGRLRSCQVRKCNMIDSIFVGGYRPLPCLEELYLVDMLRLQCIWREPKTNEGLQNLKVLHVRNCPSLTKVFTVATIKGLPKLEELRVERCEEMVEIIGFSGDIEEERDIVSSLKKLVLVELSSLRRICKEDLKMMRWSSLERLEVSNCPRLKALPLQGDKQSNLMELRGQREWWEKLEWRDRGVKELLQQNFTVL
ncbi:Disease resistance protein [Acorus gramineus]|uniref:Disease resistance protein n=1 Tax=Acorus gramineus TaxID=55184 RepID=A0AAV9B6V9_ACOGR|nr:Disease resistance protein [Acorus gramineus]